MSEQTKTLYLWLLECKDARFPCLSRLFTFYAESREEADRLVDCALTLQSHLVFVSLIERPDGFIFLHYKRPGQIEVDDEL